MDDIPDIPLLMSNLCHQRLLFGRQLMSKATDFAAMLFTALHKMQTRSSDKNSVCLSICPSVCQTRGL